MQKIIKFEKSDCPPCNMVSEYLDRKGIVYEKVDAFEEPERAMQYKIRTVPTVLVLNTENEILTRIAGFKPEELSRLAALS